MIGRIWRALVKTEEANNYTRHLQNDTFPRLSRILRFVSASILRKHTARGVEFIVLITWQSMDAIRQFAGETIDMAVVPQTARSHDGRLRHDSHSLRDCRYFPWAERVRWLTGLSFVTYLHPGHH